MARFCFLPLAGIPLLLLHGASGQTTTNPVVEAANCLSVMNEARGAVGFTEFTAIESDKSQLLIPKEEDKKSKKENFWKAVCNGAPVEEVSEMDKPEGTYAYFPQSKAEPECAAAVAYWKSAFAIFGTDLPPVYHTPQTRTTADTPYDNDKVVSFLALYNPKPEPTAECAVVTCPPKSSLAGRTLNADSPAYTLFCVTNPPVLTDTEAPYKEDEWRKIMDVFASSTSSAAPTFVALVAAALGLALF